MLSSIDLLFRAAVEGKREALEIDLSVLPRPEGVL